MVRNSGMDGADILGMDVRIYNSSARALQRNFHLQSASSRMVSDVHLDAGHLPELPHRCLC